MYDYQRSQPLKFTLEDNWGQLYPYKKFPATLGVEQNFYY